MVKSISSWLSKVEWIAITCDIWSSRSRSFFGVTGHWIDSDLNRHSIVLALKRFSGSHSWDRIIPLIKEILTKFQIERKTISATTDNGSNLIKAFRLYGLEDIPDTSEETEDGDGENVEMVTIKQMPVIIPEHFRCASHTLSLVATEDLTKVYK